MHVCFVCTGNTCRSPMAANVFRSALAGAGLGGVRVSSAGTDVLFPDVPADPRAVSVLTTHGYPPDHLTAHLSPAHLEADLLVALTEEHAHVLLARGVPQARVRLLRSFDPDATSLDLLDPFSGELPDYVEVLRMVEAAVPGLLAHVRRWPTVST